MVVYHENVSGSVTPRTLGPYEFIATPPQQLVLNAIVEQCGVGDCISPGVRGLAEQTGVSRGLITDCLRTLADDGWIDYDGRNITLLRDPAGGEDPGDAGAESPPRTADRGDRSPDRSVEPESEEVIDQMIDHYIAADLSDRSPDRSAVPSPILAAVQRHTMRQNDDPARAKKSDRSPDRSVHMVHDQVPTTTSPVVVHESSTTGGSGGTADRSPDRPHPAAHVMAELGADPRVIADALQARPDWTPQQVRDRWAYDQRRIDASDGRLAEGVFFHALRCGQLAPARRVETDWGALAAQQQTESPPDAGESLHDRAARLVPASPTDRYSGQDFVWMQGQLLMQDWTDDQAIQALQARRRWRSGPGGTP